MICSLVRVVKPAIDLIFLKGTPDNRILDCVREARANL